MFIHLPGQTTLGVVPDQVVAIIESINAPNIGTPIGTERTKAFIVGLRLPSGNFTVAIYLHVLDTNRACIYAADPLEVGLDGYSTLEAEAIQFGESMGFMLDNMNFRARPPEEIQRAGAHRTGRSDAGHRLGTAAARAGGHAAAGRCRGPAGADR
jgi:hypothetical protein